MPRSARNRIKTITKQVTGDPNTETVTFKYDPFGRRIEKNVSTYENNIPTTYKYTYVYDNEDIILEIEDKTQSGNTTTTTTAYTHGPGIDEPLSLERGGQRYYYHADGLGSITSITDASQAVVNRYAYDSFGAVKKSETIRSAYAFTGREFDSETGLYYYRARYYDPEVGRFVSKDPIGFAGGDVNVFNYVNNRPTMFVDPYGLQGIECKTSKCNKTWDQCYTNCINKLVPGFREFFVGSQIIGNLPYRLNIRAGSQGLVVREIPSALSILFPRVWQTLANVSNIVRPVQGVVFSYAAGASCGCMISCAVDPCSY